MTKKTTTSGKENNDNINNTEHLESNCDAAPEEATPKSEIEILEERLSEEKNNYLRLMADFDNFRKRMCEQTTRLRQDGVSYAIETIFPVLDSMDRAIGCVDDANKEGILLIKKQFDTALKALGVEEIGEIGKEFDPNIHHAVMRIEDEEKSGQVVEVFQKGYKFKDNVIRCAMVKVAE